MPLRGFGKQCPNCCIKHGNRKNYCYKCGYRFPIPYLKEYYIKKKKNKNKNKLKNTNALYQYHITSPEYHTSNFNWLYND